MIHSCNSIKNPGQPCLACVYGVDDSIVNGLESNQKMMIALATLAVGGGLALYLYNKGDKAQDTKKADTAPEAKAKAPRLDVALDPEVAEGIVNSIGDVIKLAIVTGGLPPLTLDGTVIYRYIPSTDAVYINSIQASQETDSIGNLAAIPFTGNSFIEISKQVPRLGLASDVQGGTSKVILPVGLSGFGTYVSQDQLKNRSSQENRLLLAGLLKIDNAPTMSEDDLKRALYRALYAGNSMLAIASARLALAVCGRVSRYWMKRAIDANKPAGSYVKLLNRLDEQRIAAALFWAIAQTPTSSLDNSVFESMSRGLERLATRLGYNPEKIYDIFPKESTLYPKYINFINMFNAFASGVFNCENPETDTVDIPLNIIDSSTPADAINLKVDARSAKAVASPVFLAGAIFYKSNSLSL